MTIAKTEMTVLSSVDKLVLESLAQGGFVMGEGVPLPCLHGTDDGLHICGLRRRSGFLAVCVIGRECEVVGS